MALVTIHFVFFACAVLILMAEATRVSFVGRKNNDIRSEGAVLGPQRGTFEYTPNKRCGNRPRSASTAFVTLHYVLNDDFASLVDVRVLFQSLRGHGAKSDLVALIPDNNAAFQSCAILEKDGVRVVRVKPVQLPSDTEDISSNHRWQLVFTKLAAWTLDYERVVLLDSDMLFTSSFSPDIIFNQCPGAEVCMAKDFSSEFNAGVILLRPDVDRAHLLLNAATTHATSQQHHYVLPDQDFLSDFAHNESNNFQIDLLGHQWNSCSPVEGTTAEESLIHFCGKEKPRLQLLPWSIFDVPYDTELTAWDRDQLVKWQHTLVKSDTCVAHWQSDCEAIRTCQWCAQERAYCLDARIPCSEELFSGIKWKDEYHVIMGQKEIGEQMPSSPN